MGGGAALGAAVGAGPPMRPPPSAFLAAAGPRALSAGGAPPPPAAAGGVEVDMEKPSSLWSEAAWVVRQSLLDPEGDDDWFIEGTIDLAKARESGRPILALTRVAT